MKLSPKDRFQRDKDAVNYHLDLVSRSQVLDSIETALAEMVLQLAPTNNPGASWSNAAKIDGAREFLGIWLSLGDPPVQLRNLSPGLEPVPNPHAGIFNPKK